MLRTRSPVVSEEASFFLLPLDLHVLGLPLAFILSQDQTLHCMSLKLVDSQNNLTFVGLSHQFKERIPWHHCASIVPFQSPPRRLLRLPKKERFPSKEGALIPPLREAKGSRLSELCNQSLK